MKTVEVAGDKTVTNFQNHNYIQHLKKEDKNWKEILSIKATKYYECMSVSDYFC